MPALHLGWVSHVAQVAWDGDSLRIQGWGYTRGTEFRRTPKIEVLLYRRWAAPLVADVVPMTDPQVNGAARKAEFDYSNTAFEARWSREMLSQVRSGRTYRVRIKISGGGRRFWGPVRTLSAFGSGAAMTLRRDPDSTLVGPVWHDRRGLLVIRRQTNVNATDVQVRDRELVVSVDQAATSVSLDSDTQQPVELRRDTSAPGWTFVGQVPERQPAVDHETGRPVPAKWSLNAKLGSRIHPVALDCDPVPPGIGSPLSVRADNQQGVELIDAPVFVEVHSVELEDDTSVRLEGRIVGYGPDVTLALVGGRARLAVELTVDGESFTGRAHLRVAAWGGPELPPMRGAYSLLVAHGGEQQSTFVTAELARAMPRAIHADDYRLQFQLDRRDQFRLHVGRPRRPHEFGSFNQGKLQRKHNLKPTPRDAVFFESFVGRNATCNPRAMDAEIARRFPDLPRYWSVDDLSIAVPDGAIPLVIGTTEWWQARTTSRWVVTNEWLGATFRKQKFQTVLQTWHGSMYKKIGLDRANMSRRHFRLLREERARWDMFISQNAPGTEIIKSAYELDSEDVIEVGYPRNDELHQVDEQRRADIRARLGVPADSHLVMYAPTWRDQDVEGNKVELVDLPALTNDLGPDWVVLLRGHVRTLAHSDAVENDGIIDVSTYPQVSELFMVADILITDYSSMMFDFSVTGKPMVFFAPDIDDYTNDAVRGTYFDLGELAPGPVIRTQDELAGLLTDLSWRDSYESKYAAWNKMFNHLDDGDASGRATDALFRSSLPAS